MKNRIVYLLLIVFINFSSVLYAQQPTYPVKVIDGIEYYIYTVEAGEGLYSISRRFGVTQADINNANPKIHEGLKAGQDILIPKMDEKSTVVSPQASDDVEYLLHTVERRQTLFAISRKYNVTQEDIIQSNPFLRERSIKRGDVLRIPIVKKSGTKHQTKPTVTPTRPSVSERTLHVGANETYFTHHVTRGETLYSICRRYNVTQQKVKELNPFLHERGIQANDILRIPLVKKEGPRPTRPVTSENTLHVGAEDTYFKHIVTKGETLYSISRRYNVSQKTIIQLNPFLRERSIQPQDVLHIPLAKNSTTKPAVTATRPKTSERTLHIGTDETYITHKVSQGETLYSISRRYNVSVDDLKRLNPETEKGLMAGSVLKIPFQGDSKPDDGKVVSSESVATAPVVMPREPKTTYKIAYLLPFMQNNPNDVTAEKFIEFYMGSLLAINNVKNGDMKFEIYSFDTEKTETKIHEIINKPEMQEMDLIVGPAYTIQTPILADFAKRRRINTVIPFSSKVTQVQDNPYLFQFNPDQDTQNDYVRNLIKNKFNNAQIIFVETNNMRWSDDSMDFYSHLKQHFDRQRIGYALLKAENFANSLNKNLASDRKNILIFNTDDYNTVQNYLTDLYTISNQFDVGVLGQYSWRNYRGKKPKMYYVAPFAGNKLGTQFYEQEFKKYYKDKLPLINPRFDLLGYDITTYFLSLMTRDGFKFNESTQSLNFNRGVQSNFEFKRTGKNGGFVNQQMYLIEDDAVSR